MGSIGTAWITYKSGELTEPPGHVDRQHTSLTLLQSQVGQVVGEAAQLLGYTCVAQIQHDVEAQGLQGWQVALPGKVIKLDASWVLLVLRKAQHLQVVVTHKVLCLHICRASSYALRTKTVNRSEASTFMQVDKKRSVILQLVI